MKTSSPHPLVVLPLLLIPGVAAAGLWRILRSQGAIGAAICALAASLLLMVGLLAARRRRMTVPPDGVTLAHVEAELPLVADHRDIFGPGVPQHVFQGPGWTALEMKGRGVDRSFVVVELRHRLMPWAVARMISGTDRDQRFEWRYYVIEGPVPSAAQEFLGRRGEIYDEVRIAGNLLILQRDSPADPGWVEGRWPWITGLARALDSEPA